MDFPIADLMDEDACYAKLVALLHPDGLACPRCRPPTASASTAATAPRCSTTGATGCGRVFNAFTGTALPGTHRTPVADRADPPRRRPGRAHGPAGPRAGLRPQAPARAAPAPCRSHAERWLDRNPLGDAVVEADEMYQNAGEKGRRTPTPTTRRGGGPTAGGATAPSPTTGRRWPGWSAASRARSGWRWSTRPAAAELDEFVGPACLAGATVNTDEWERLQPGRWPSRAGPRDGRTTRGRGDLGDRRRRRRGARGALQHAGGDLDGAAELPAAVPRGEQVVPVAVRGDLPVGL